MTPAKGRASRDPGGSPHPGEDQPELPFDRGLPLAERFERFHADNPAIYAAVVSLARRYRAETGRMCGIQRLIEAARFDLEMKSSGDEEFAINNDYAAFYARLIMLREHDLAGFFELRRSREADEWITRLRVRERRGRA